MPQTEQSVTRGEVKEIVDEAIEKLAGMISDGFTEQRKYTDSKFDEVKQYTDGKFDEVKQYTDGKFDGAKQYTDGKFDEVNSRLDKVDSRLDKVDGRLDKIEVKIDHIDQKVTLAITHQNKHGQRLDRIEKHLDLEPSHQ